MQFEIRCVPEGEALWPMRTFVTSIAREIGFPEEDVDKIELAVDEACANVIRHAYKHLGVSSDLDDAGSAALRSAHSTRLEDCYLLVRIIIEDRRLGFQIIDRGIGIDHTPRGALSIHEYLERGGKGGLGIFIIQNFMEDVRVEPRDGGGTILSMAKRLVPAEAPAGA
jgi:serine/threonine-protein kinase RsbW